MKKRIPDAVSEAKNKFFLGFCKCIRILFLLSSFDCGRMKGWKEKVRKI